MSRALFTRVGLVLCTGALGYCLPLPFDAPHAHARGEALRLPGEHFTEPLLACETQRAPSELDLTALQAVMAGASTFARQTDRARRLSAHFIDLNSGAATGLDEGQRYCPASLMKLADLLALLRRAAATPEVLTALVTPGAGPTTHFEQGVKPRHPLVPGRAYSVEALAEQMIVESDNMAAFALHEVITFPEVVATLEALDVSMPERPRPDTEFITAGGFATLLEVLYNGTYLGPELSEKALGWLARAEVNAGLAEATPPGVTLAHKFGERHLESGDPGLSSQFHDCGIVYHPRRPYVLCVMSAGEAQGGLTEAVAETARRVYAEVERQTHPAEE